MGLKRTMLNGKKKADKKGKSILYNVIYMKFKAKLYQQKGD